MNIKDFTQEKKKAYIFAIFLTILTFFATNMLDSKLQSLITTLSFFIYLQIALYFLKRNTLILQMHNGLFDKDVKCYLYLDNKKLDFFKVRGYDNMSTDDIHEKLRTFLNDHATLFKTHSSLVIIGFTDEEKKYISNII